MAAATTPTLRVKGLGRQKLGELARKARRLGTTPEHYVKQLVEEDLAISQEARTKSFSELMGPARGEEVDEEEIDRLVEKAKTRHHRNITRKKRN